MNNTNTINAIAEALAAWNKIEAAARQQFPLANDEQIYQICRGAMNKSLDMK